MDIRSELFEKLAEADVKETSACIEDCPKKGVEIIRLSPEEQARWKEASLFLWKEYMKDIDQRAELQIWLKQKGLNGEKIVMKIDELVKKHSK